MEYRDRVRLDRYAVKNPDAQLQINDMVVASLQRKFDRTGRPVESREIGWVQSVNPDGTYDVKLDTDGTTEPKIPRNRLDYVTEKTYPDICHRVATAISTVEKKKDRKKFAEAVEAAMVAERFVPAGRILSGLGRPGYDLTLFNCYVFNITQDSRRGITEHWGRLFETYSRGGGVGTPLSVLRPKGTVVRKVNGRSSGSVSWAEQFSQITGAVEQGGCFALYSKIDTPEGPVAANELANKYNQGATVYVSTHCGAKRITNVFRNGIKPTYRIGVRCGHDVHVTTVSDDHKIITNRQTDASVETMPGWYFVDVANAAPGIDVAVLKNNDVVVGQITEVLYVGEQETVDFEVADVHILSSDGIYTSNSRRGAAMLCQWCWHPDVLELVDVKSLREEIQLPDGKTFSMNKNLLCNANVSILLTEGFMQAVQQNADWDLVFPDTDAPGYDAQWNGDIWRWRDELKKPVVVYRTIKARDLWNRIIQHAWEAGEPGIIFMERANQMSNSWYYAPLIGTNPCSEQVLPDNAVCNLAHLNLGRYVTTTTLPHAVQTTEQAKQAFDWETLKADVQMGVRFLDNVNDLNVYHDDAVKKQQLSERRIGLGILGYGDALMRLGLRYGSDDAIAFTDELMRVFTTTAYKASVQLAKERGAFPRFQADHFLNSGFMKQMPKDVRALVRKHGIRNVTITTIAPTGSTAVLMNTSTGCEPFFDLQYTSTTRIGIVKEKSGVVDQIFQQFGTEPQKWPQYVVTAQRGITPAQHVKTQATMQRWICSAISKCIAAGTLIPTNKGLIPVEAFADIHKVNTFVPTDGKFKTSGHRILSHYRAGKKAATRIRLDNGAELVGATESHRVLTPAGWCRMVDLKPGDLVVCRLQASHGKGGMPLAWTDKMRSNANKIKTPKRMTPAFAEFLGMLAADGHTLETTGCVGLTCKNNRVAANFRKLCRKIFGITPKETIDKRNGVLHIYLTSRNLVRFIESIMSKGAYNKHAPTAVLQGNYKEKLAFLTGITLDGYATQQGLVIYEGMSKDLAYHVAEIARSFGLPYVCQGSKWVAATKAYTHSVMVSNELQEIIIPIEQHKRKTATYKRLKVFADVHKIPRSAFYSRSTEYYALRGAQCRNQKYLFNTTAKALGISADIFVHKVTKVEDAGIVEMYDVEVEDAHEYVVNGMVSHNTINLPANATVKDVADAYMLMWELGCKGGTVYRDGSRDVQVLYTDKPVPIQVVEASPETAVVRPRPNAGMSVTFSEESPIGTIHLTIRHDPQTGDPIDVFVITGKGDASADGEAIGRLMSMILRFPNDQKINQQMRLELIRDQLIDILGRGQVGFGPEAKRSMPDAIAKILNRYLEADFPVANLPFGIQPMKELLDELRTCGGDVTKLDQISRYVLEGDPGNGHDVDEYRAEMETEIQKAEHDGIKLPYDYCPGCGNCTLVIIPGKCPCCRTCGYTQC